MTSADRPVPLFQGLLEEMTIDEVRAMDPQVVVMPMGSTEPHGPHLPYGADFFQVQHYSRLAVQKANARGARALLYPTMPITNNSNFRRFPFALRMGIRTLMAVLIDMVTQVRDDGVMKVVFVCGHGGNLDTLRATMREISGMDNMPFVCTVTGPQKPGFVSPIEHPSDHGGESETSRSLYARPELVRTDKLADNPFGKLKYPLLARTEFVRPWHGYVPVSAGGETRKASAEKGRIVVDSSTDLLADILVELGAAQLNDRFPYE